jgi:hypothetical protein
VTGAPDIAGTIVAWRVWRVVCRDGAYRLGSIVQPTLWEPGEALVADCHRPAALAWLLRKRRHVSPDERCDCGIYATSLAHLRPGLARVVGQVSLWGTVVECEHGYRASRAYPLKVYVPADSSRGAARWHELVPGLGCYGVPVEPLAARADEAVETLEQRTAA